MPWLWAVFTVLASGGQVLRNAMQKELTATLGTVGATHVRFLFGLPFSLLFLTLVLGATRLPVPELNAAMIAWTTAAALAQIAATALLLAAMQARSFVVTTAYAKTEPVQVAIFGLAFLGDQVTAGQALAIVVATAGVLVMSWPEDGLGRGLLVEAGGARYRLGRAVRHRRHRLPRRHPGAGSIQLRGRRHHHAGAGACSFRRAVLTTYLLLADRPVLVAIFKAWRPSLFAGFMGAFASQMWYLAFALETAAKVRTLALIEILFAQVLSRNLFKQSVASRDAAGIGLIVIGVVLLLNF